ncbi:hypothetical protein GNZ01_07205 [Escherichia coli]|uniref:Uncharacterized protein n=1 Tax=Escherichia coli TaxID=562 RepID=A0AAJ2Y373_ECOLX|nr:hypothetical protein [Escherichia coli]MUM71681.1 hypothetical protein [Escherichia coli]MUM83038.1 hypothetical protein [Escherichia coli]
MSINANKCCSADVHLFFKKLANDIIYMQEMIYHKRADLEKALVQFSFMLDGDIFLESDALRIVLDKNAKRFLFHIDNKLCSSVCRTFYNRDSDLYQFLYSKGAVEASYGDGYALGKSIPFMKSFKIEHISTDEDAMFTNDITMGREDAMRYITNSMHTFFQRTEFDNVYISNVNIFNDLCQYLRSVCNFDESYCKLYTEV